MKKSKKVAQSGRARVFRAGAFACALLVAGVATAVAAYASRSAAPPRVEPAAAQPTDPYVTVEVAGRKVQVNAQTLQNGPLTQEQARQLAAQLEGNKATAGLVQERQPDGTVSVDLQGRFRNVTLARRNDDGTVTTACVDTPETAGAFLGGAERAESVVGTGTGGKATARK